MKLRLFLLSCLVCFGSSDYKILASISPSCQLTVKLEKTDSEGVKKGEFKLVASGGKAPYKFVVYKSSGHLISEDFNKSEFKNLEADIYQAIVVDENGCKHQLEIQLK
jgi:hypothetical protein